MKTALLCLALLVFSGCCFLYGSYTDVVSLRAIHANRPINWQPALVWLTDSTAYLSFGLALPLLIAYFVKRKTAVHRISPTVANPSFKASIQTPKPTAINRSSNTYLAESLTLLSALLLTTILVQTIKALVDRPRPYQVYPFIHKLSDAGGGSFPSGHTADAFTVLSFFALGNYPVGGTILAFIWACAVAYTRMALGVHYGSDVLGAAFLGIGSAWCTRTIASRVAFRKPHSLTLDRTIVKQ